MSVYSDPNHSKYFVNWKSTLAVEAFRIDLSFSFRIYSYMAWMVRDLELR